MDDSRRVLVVEHTARFLVDRLIITALVIMGSAELYRGAMKIRRLLIRNDPGPGRLGRRDTRPALSQTLLLAVAHAQIAIFSAGPTIDNPRVTALLGG